MLHLAKKIATNQFQTTLKIFRAIIGKDGKNRSLEDVKLYQSQEVLVTIIDEKNENNVHEPVTTYLSNQSIENKLVQSEKDEAWMHLQQSK